MIIKTEVTPEERDLIKSYASSEGKTMTAYLRDRALCGSADSSPRLMKCIEIQSSIAQNINELATTILKNKAIYEEEILELLDRMTALEKANAEALKEVRKRGNTRKQKRKGNSSFGGEVQQQPRQKSPA